MERERETGILSTQEVRRVRLRARRSRTEPVRADEVRAESSGCARGCSRSRTRRVVVEGALAKSAERRRRRGELPDAELL